MDPAFTLRKPNGTRYRVIVLCHAAEEDRYLCDAEFVTEPATPVRYFQWSQATYERARHRRRRKAQKIGRTITAHALAVAGWLPPLRTLAAGT